ncbi:MAG TPA: ATP-binding protein [Nakamurella sp.]
MATATARTTEDVTDGAMVDARRYMFVTGSEDARTIGPSDLLRRLGVLRPDGRLTQAGVLLFCPADRTDIAMSMLDVEGGDVLLPASDLAGLSIEQLSVTEDRLDSVNTDITVRGGFAESRIRRVPSAAVREAVLNALVHRDWLQPDPVTVTWSQADSALQVISPGGFVGGITSQTLLMQRFARHPALADLFRALGLVEKQGLGVDRMYREMVALGRRPPMIVEGPARESGFVWSAATRSSRSWRSPRTSGSAA